jgi:hypothetical protein
MLPFPEISQEGGDDDVIVWLHELVHPELLVTVKE